ncbi:MAG: DUF1598 domain-containing protein, partial [Planctomycetia bacterium]|nr:DUF1598 domain-containing protein [Planctomycetia bacterium]
MARIASALPICNFASSRLCRLVAILLVNLPLSGRAAYAAANVAARIAAGEFGPALIIANGVNDAALRDKLLGNIAIAQGQAGAPQAALDTAADIRSDLTRKAALGSLSTTPINSTGGKPRGARGGSMMADFDSLIELITSTLKPDSWDDVGGPGAIDEFRSGVYVDSAGVLRKLPTSTDASLVAVHRAGLEATQTGNPRRSATLRKVSLTRLEREVQLLAAQGREPSEAMQTLAGLQRIKYILVYPESGDIVIAGPASDWRRDAEGRFVDSHGAPVLNLDDLVVTLRNAITSRGSFGCSIDPRKDNLAAAKAVQEKWSQQPLKPGQRDRWLNEIRDALGRQDITMYGIDRRTHAGRVLVEADYRMKLVGIGLEEGVAGVSSYLSSIVLGKDGKPPPMNVLRWWFTLNYDSLSATERRDAFELRGPGVKVLSENEFLNERGERVHTGDSDIPTRQFAESFTKHFDKLATKYPVYAELRNVFDLALISAVIESHDLPGQVGWHMTHFGPG